MPVLVRRGRLSYHQSPPTDRYSVEASFAVPVSRTVGPPVQSVYCANPVDRGKSHLFHRSASAIEAASECEDMRDRFA